MTEQSNVVPISEDVLPQDLKDKISAVRALATSHNLLDTGHFPASKLEAVRQCLAFIHNIYEQAVADALAHPDADKSPDLVHLKSVMVVKDGDAMTIPDAENIVAARKKRAKRQAKAAKK
jgi:hypothetical protein